MCHIFGATVEIGRDAVAIDDTEMTEATAHARLELDHPEQWEFFSLGDRVAWNTGPCRDSGPSWEPAGTTQYQEADRNVGIDQIQVDPQTPSAPRAPASATGDATRPCLWRLDEQ